MEKDNRLLDEILRNDSNNDHISDNQDDYDQYAQENDQDEDMNTHMWNSDSTFGGGNEDTYEQDKEQKINNQIDIALSQAINMISIHPDINKR